MPTRLAISSDLEHDGDGTVRYRVEAESPGFSGYVSVWGNDTVAADLARLLRGFPSAAKSKVEYAFGSRGVTLRFESISPMGHCRVWIVITSESPAKGGDEHESASISVDFLPAEMDQFCRALAKFTLGRFNEAMLGRDAS
jgi:hypothetical protein